MLKAISPQKVTDDSLGYIVQVVDRYHVEYIESSRQTSVEVDFCSIIGIYQSTLTAWNTPDGNLPMSDGERRNVLSRIERALQFMGSKVELY